MEPDRIDASQHPTLSRRNPPSLATAIGPPAATLRESAQIFYRRHGQHRHAAPAATLASTTKALKEVAITVSSDHEASTSTKNKEHANVGATKNKDVRKPHSGAKHSRNTTGATSTSLHRGTAGGLEPYHHPSKGGRRGSSTRDGSQNHEVHSHHNQNTHGSRRSRGPREHTKKEHPKKERPRNQHYQNWQGQNHGFADQFQSGLACNRQWENMETTGGRSSSNPSFSIMTYNLLANSLANNNRHLYHGYLDVALNWKQRCATLLAELQSTNLDIFCLQELDEQDYRYAFEPMFRSRGYHESERSAVSSYQNNLCGYYSHLVQSSTRDDQVGAAKDVAWQGRAIDEATTLCDTYCLLMRFLMSKDVDVSKMPEHFMSGTDGVYNGSVKYFENNLGRFHHAFPNTTRPGSGTIGLPMAANAHGCVDVDLTNFPLSTGHNTLDPIVSQPFNFENAYAGQKSFGPDGEICYQNAESYKRQWTTFHKRARMTCDYILYGHLRESPPYQGNGDHRKSGHGLEVSARLKLPCVELSETHGMPTWDFGSDHLSLAARFNVV
ncbi:Protein angel 2 [Mortierella alpina]|nr:Protein angel 2 [Mortierella alpina]